jgi:hypothetical protein
MLISEEAIGIRKNKKCSRATSNDGEAKKKVAKKTTTTHPPTVRPNSKNNTNTNNVEIRIRG